jgi:two-component system response regulator FixJ
MAEAPVIHVIDDDEAMRSSLLFLLATADLPARGHASAAAFLACLPAEETGCVVTDVRMPGMSGIELLRRLKVQGSRLPVIVITGHGDVPLAVEAMKAGAVDFLEKPFDDAALLAAVRAALARRQMAAEQDRQCQAIRARLAMLTARERQVLDGLVAGQPNKTIAYDLGISPRTVEIYRAHVMSKLQAGSLSELVRMAFIARGSGPQPQD